jgi:hypothetical protein
LAPGERLRNGQNVLPYRDFDPMHACTCIIILLKNVFSEVDRFFAPSKNKCRGTNIRVAAFIYICSPTLQKRRDNVFLQFYSIRFQFNGECYKEHKSRIILRTRFVYNYNTKEYLEWKINVFEKSDIKSLVETHSLTLFSLLYDIECFQIEFGDHKNFRRLYFAQKGSLCVLKFKKVEKNFLLYVPITFALHTQVCNTT